MRVHVKLFSPQVKVKLENPVMKVIHIVFRAHVPEQRVKETHKILLRPTCVEMVALLKDRAGSEFADDMAQRADR